MRRPLLHEGDAHGAGAEHPERLGLGRADLLAATVKAIGSKLEDGLAFAKALRRTPYDAVRGPDKYNVNGIPIQDFIKREVVRGDDGKPKIVGREVIFKDHKDSGKSAPKKSASNFLNTKAPSRQDTMDPWCLTALVPSC